MTRHAAAYHRRSSVSSDSPGDASEAAQTEAGERLAAAFAPGVPLVVYRDWGISGRRADRPEYLRLKADIAAGRVCCVFAYSLSRLGRTARELDVLFSLCEAHDVSVVTLVDGTLTATTATGRFLRKILAELAELESELAKERSASARAAKRARGDDFGAGYGERLEKQPDGRLVRVPDPAQPVEPIIAAYREAGSILQTAVLLTERGVPAPRGGSWWSPNTVSRILARSGVLSPKTATGRRTSSRALLAGLVRCHCGHIMTPNETRGQLYCSHGHRPDHTGRYAVTVAALMPYVRAEAALLTMPGEYVTDAEAAARLAAIEAERERLGLAFSKGAINERVLDVELAALKRRAEEAAAERLQPIAQAVDFDDDAAFVNEQLRAMWVSVDLDRTMRPTRTQWRRPEWRATT